MERLTKLNCEALKATLAGRRVPPPEGSAPIWNAFMALSRTRSASASGPGAITYQEIDSWSRLMRTPLEPHHIETLMEMDRVWLDHVYAGRDTPSALRNSGQPLTAEMFDLLL